MLLINSLQTNYCSRSYLFSYENTTSGFYVDSFWQLFYFLLLFLSLSVPKVQWRCAWRGWQLVRISVAEARSAALQGGSRQARRLKSLLHVHPGVNEEIPYVSGGFCNNHCKAAHAHFCLLQDFRRTLKMSGKEELKHMPHTSPLPMPILMADSNNGSQIYFSLWIILNTVPPVGITNCCYLW